MSQDGIDSVSGSLSSLDRLIAEWGGELQYEWAERLGERINPDLLRGALIMVCLARKAHAESLRSQAELALYGHTNKFTEGLSAQELGKLIIEPANHIIQEPGTLPARMGH